MLECEELFQHPLLYSAFLLWLLDELYNTLPEVGDGEKPKMVFFFDEAHLLFDDAPKRLVDKIEQTVKLIRSKGVGVFFCTQMPSDISPDVLAQLSNRIQHSLRAYTPAEIKAVKQAADSFRQNPELDTAETITSMKTGTALVSVLDEDGAPTIVQKTKILPPKSSMNIAPEETVRRYIETDSIYGKYEKAFDPDSAYEEMEQIYEREEAERQAAAEAREQAKIQAQREKQEAREQAKREKEKADWGSKLAKKAQNKLENEALNIGIRSARKFLKGLLK